MNICVIQKLRRIISNIFYNLVLVKPSLLFSLVQSFYFRAFLIVSSDLVDYRCWLFAILNGNHDDS